MKKIVLKVIRFTVVFLVITFIMVILQAVAPFSFSTGFGTFGRDIVLSHGEPQSRRWGVELVAISNLSASIKILKTGEIISATKGQQVTGYADKFLYLIEISTNKGEILLRKYSFGPIPAIK